MTYILTDYREGQQYQACLSWRHLEDIEQGQSCKACGQKHSRARAEVTLRDTKRTYLCATFKPNHNYKDYTGCYPGTYMEELWYRCLRLNTFLCRDVYCCQNTRRCYLLSQIQLGGHTTLTPEILLLAMYTER